MNPLSIRKGRFPARVSGILAVLASALAGALGEDLEVSSDMTLDPGVYNYDVVVIRANNTLTLRGDPATGTGVQINADSLVVEADGVISASGQGYPLNQGPGANPDPNFGPSHGGRGGRADYSAAYGSAVRPLTLGSGANNTWGNNGSGGGAIHLVVGGTTQVEGRIESDAHLGWTAAGGSILIETGSISGSGTIRANGGRGACPSCGGTFPGGGGGRVAVTFVTANTFGGTAEARGGANSKGEYTGLHGEEGTVGFFDVSNPAQIKLDAGPSWRFQANDAVAGEAVYHDITLHDSKALIEPGVTARAISQFTMSRSAPDQECTLGIFADSGSLSVAAGDFTLDEGCVIDMEGKGHPLNEGPGANPDQDFGPSHGGRGGRAEYSAKYGTAIRPTTLGSGANNTWGNDGSGGGAVYLNVEGTAQIEGAIEAGANLGWTGAGGSILIDTGTFSGSGSLNANGGRGACPSCTATFPGGGGGRIAIYYEILSSFSGSAEVRGGANSKGSYTGLHGEDGTAGFFDVSNPAQVKLTTGPSWHFEEGDSVNGETVFYDILLSDTVATVAPGVRLRAENAFSMTRSAAPMESRLSLAGEIGTIAVTATDMEIGADCVIEVDGKGYPTGQGPGASAPVTGAGHGGRGGEFFGPGGPTYGSSRQPTDFGSSSEEQVGGVGGGALRLSVEDTLVLDGVLSADAVVGNAGGSSGGSIWVDARRIEGAGVMSADGARAGCTGCSAGRGGGGGGRIAIHYGEDAFSGGAEARGGPDNQGNYPPTGAAEDGTVLWIREIPIAIGASATIHHDPLVHYTFVVDWAGSEMEDTALIRLTPAGASGSWELKGERSQPPGPGQSSWQGVLTQAGMTYEMLVPLREAGPYYFDVYNEAFGGAGGSFTLEVLDVQRYLLTDDLGKGSNAGSTTILIAGAGFEPGMRVQVRTSGGALLKEFAPAAFDSTSMAISADLTGLSVQVADIAVIWPDDDEQVIPAGFEITGDPPGSIEISTSIPRVTRALRSYTMWVTLRNVGGTDVEVPILRVRSEQERAMRLSTADPFVRRNLLVVPIRDRAPVTVLPPGQEIEFPVYFVTEGGAHTDSTFVVESLTESTVPLDWTVLKPQWKPAGLSNEAWDIIWTNFTGQVGSTWTAFADRMREDARWLWLHENPTHDMRRLTDLEFAAAAAATGLAQPQISQLDVAAPVDAPNLRFVRFCSNSLFSRLHQGSLGLGWTHSFDYWLEFVPADLIQLRIPGRFVRRFFKSPRGVWQPRRRDHGRLTETPAGYELKDDTRTMVFAPDGRLLSVNLPNERSLELQYIGELLTSVTHSDGYSLSFEYTENVITRVIDHAGRETEYVYESGQLKTVNQAGGGRYDFTYFDSGAATNAIQTITHPSGARQEFTYDAAGRSANSSRNGGVEPSTYSYPELGAIEVADALGNIGKVAFDGDDLPLRVTMPDGEAIHFAYDEEERTEVATLPDGSTTWRRFDAFGHPVQSVNQAGERVGTEFSPMTGRIRWFEDPLGLRTNYEYDQDANLTRITFADNSSHQYTRGADGRVAQWTNARGLTVDFVRNAEGRVTEKDVQDGAVSTYSYNTKGLLESFEDPSGQTSLGYNAATDLFETASYPDGTSWTIASDDAGRPVGVSDHAGFSLGYEYEPNGRLAAILDGSGNLIIEYEYDAAGQLVTETRGNGSVSTYGYDSNGRLLQIDHRGPGNQPIERFTYTYDPNGRCVSARNMAGEKTEYAYDAAGRLNRIEYDGGETVSYTYDRAGNRMTRSTPGETDRYTTNGRHQYLQAGSRTLQYDADGNLKDDGTFVYEFDAENRMTGVDDGGANPWSYAYDGLGQRKSAVAGGTTTNFLNVPNGIGQVVGEYDGAGQITARYIHGPRLVAMIDAAGNLYYYGFDRTGHTRFLTDSMGAVVNTYEYGAFGESRETVESLPNPYRFAGGHGVRTESNGLLFMKHRYYDPELGRFVSPDPAGLAGGTHAYTYAENDPVNRVDPDGLGSTLVSWGIDLLWGDVPNPVDDIFNDKIEEGVDKLRDVYTVEHDNAVTEASDIRDEQKKELGIENLYTPEEVEAAEEGAWDIVKEVIKKLKTVLTDPKSLPKDVIKDVLEPYDGSDPPDEQWEEEDTNGTEVVAPGDPNEKTGSIVAERRLHLEPGEDDTILYTIYFENDPDIATAPAQEVIIEDRLDTNLDWSTVRLTEVSWGDYAVPIPAGTSSSFVTRFSIPDYRPDVDKLWWVDISSEIDSTGKMTWFFQTLDPETGELPEDALAGFLPVNDDSDRGQGQISFTIKPQAGLALGTSISNSATIVFDTEAPIATDPVNLRVGAPPASPLGVASVTVADGFLMVSGSGIDTAKDLILEESTDLETWSPLFRITPTGTSMGLVIPRDDNVPTYFIRLIQE